MNDYQKIASDLGALVTEKQLQYGDSVTKSAGILAILFPDGVAVHQYGDALLVVRVLDKLSRIAQRNPDGIDRGGESPWKDIAGYGILGEAKDTHPNGTAIVPPTTIESYLAEKYPENIATMYVEDKKR